jgi:hypothetical protein
MSITINVNEAVETITATIVDGDETITATINELPRGTTGPQGPTGATGAAGPNSVTSSTTSDGTCNLSLDTLIVGTGTASGARSVALGNGTTASGRNSLAVGAFSASTGEHSFATGDSSTASGSISYAGGLSSLASEPLTRAVGNRAKAIHSGASVESDSQDSDVGSTAADEKTFRFANGYRFLGGSATFSGSVTASGALAGSNLSGTNTGDQTTITGNAGTATALQTSRDIFGQSFNGTGNVDGNLLTTGHLASVPSGGEAGHLITLNGATPTVVAGRSAWWANGSGVPSFRNGTGSAVTLLRSSDLGTNVATFLATPTSANLAAAVTDETGSGSLVFATSPTLTTPTFTRSGAGTVFTASQGSTSANMVTDSGGRNFFTISGDVAQGGAAGGCYLLIEGAQESWVYVNCRQNATGLRVMRFGNLSSRFQIQRLNDTNSSITATPFSFANDAPTSSFYMSTSGGVGFGTTSDPGAGGIQTAGKIIAGNTVRLKGYTFATLPAGTQGDKAFITDGAALPIFRANAAGGGSTVTEVFYNGTNWINS